KMSEARRDSLQEINQLHNEILELCSEDEDSMVENMGSGGRNSSVIFVGLSRASPQVIEDSIINLISDPSLSSDSSGNVTSSPNQATRGQASPELVIHKTSVEKPYSIEEVFDKETVTDLCSPNASILQANTSTLTSSMSSVSSDVCKMKESFKNNGTCIVCKSDRNGDKFVVASSTTDTIACTCCKTNICKEYSSTFTTMTGSKVASDNNVCSFDGGKDVEKVVTTELMISSESTPKAQKFRNENLSISSLDCSPIPKNDWRNDTSNLTPIPGINNDVSECKVVHSTPLGRHKKFPNSSTFAKSSVVRKTLRKLYSDLASDIDDHTLEYKHVNKNTSSQYISGFAALCKGDPSQKPNQIFLAKSNASLSKINILSLVEGNSAIINKKEDEKCRERNKKKVCSSPILGRFKDVSVSRSMSVLEEDILDVSEDILGLEEDVITDNEITDDKMEITLLGLDTVPYAQCSQVEDKTLTKRDHLKDNMDDEMDNTLLEDTVHEEEIVVSQEKNYDLNMKTKCLFPGLNTELVRSTDGGELEKTEKKQLSDDKKDMAVDSRKWSSQTFLFTELESGEIVSGVDYCEFDQTTLLATSDKRVFDQTTTLEKSDETEYEQRTMPEKTQLSTSIRHEKDIYKALNSSIDSFELIRSPEITKEKQHTYMFSKKDNRTVDSTRKSVTEETLPSKICTAKPKAEACTDSSTPEIHTFLSSDMLIKLRQKRRKRKLEKIMSCGKVLMRDIDPVELKEKKMNKIETKPISEEMKVTKKKRHTKKKKTKVPLEEQSEAVSNILLIAAEIAHDQGKVETNSQPPETKENSMNNEDVKDADQKIKNRDVIHLNDGVKQQQIGSSSNAFVNIEMHSSSRDSEIGTVSDVVPSSAVILQSLLVPVQNAEKLSRKLKIHHVGLPLETQKVRRSKETEDEKSEIFSPSNRIGAGDDIKNSNDKLELQMGNSQLFPKGGEKEKAVGNKEAPVAEFFTNVAMGRDGNSFSDQSNNIEKKTDFFIPKVTFVVNHGATSTITSKASSHPDVKVNDETNSVREKEEVTTVEDKEHQNKMEIVSLMQEHAALCQTLEGNKLIQQVQKKWKCSVTKTPETNLTTSLFAYHPNSSKKTESKLQGERYCTLDTEANLQLGSLLDSRKQVQKQVAKELHALEKQKEAEIASVPINIKLSKLASAHREQIRKLQFQQDLELNDLHKQFYFNSDYQKALILQIQEEHKIQMTRLRLLMKQEMSLLDKEKQITTARIAARFDQKINQLKNIAEQSQQEHLTNSVHGPYVSLELFKAPRHRSKGTVIAVCLPAGIAQALLKEDAVYDHFYSCEWNK
ncbi:hypothetical protein CHS0354_035445, partial [Potamilus streckersoni]